jgi:hypothetical protein
MNIIFDFSNAGTCNDQVRERSLESAVTEFQRRFHISVDDIEANRRENDSAVHQVRKLEFFVHTNKETRNAYLCLGFVFLHYSINCII